MASYTFVGTLGSTATRPNRSAVTSVGVSVTSAVDRSAVSSRINFIRLDWLRRQPRRNAPSQLCRCMVTTNLIEEKAIQFSPESTFRGNEDVGKNADDLLLKPPTKPVLKVQPNGPLDAVKSALWSGEKEGGEKRLDLVVKDSERVIESLGEVLEKAEKLETVKTTKLVDNNGGASNGGMKTTNSSKIEGNSNANQQMKKSKTLKSVWRKGNPVATVQRVVKEQPRAENEKVFVRKDPPLAAPRSQQGISIAAVRPTVSKSEPKLQSKPAVGPVTPPASTGFKRSDAPKDRKPILIDKFASKKPLVDPIAAEALLGPTKPVKGPSQSKVKDERRKKLSSTGAPRRRLLGNNDDIRIEEASELGVPIPGVAEARKGRKWSKASRKAARLQAAKDAAPVKVEILEVGEEGMLTEDLAYNLAISEAEILNYLFSKGVKPDKVQTLGKEMVKMICQEYDVEVIEADPLKVEEMAKKKEMLDEDDLEMLEDRPPVITIMGHVDHGKTTLLDYIRKSKVVASEAGGITQGIGAYQVQVPVDGNLRPCVFLDTPGHEAFGAMRARGARVTDVAVIVVAADDGVRPQTSEAIAHAKAALVPVIIAINKIDKDGANPDRVMQELSTMGLMPEIWGGDTPMIQISALKGENVDELLETIMLVAELQELKANPQRKAKGTVIEAGLDKSKGAVATLIVQNGTLNKGDVVVCGEAHGKVRAMFDDRGGTVNKAGPSTAVQVIGLDNVPIAGDEFEVVDSLDVARERANVCAESLRTQRISAKAGDGKVTLSSIASAVSAGKQSGLDMHQFNVILKVDFQGSVEAIRHALQVLPQDNVTLKFLLQSPGDVSISDVDLAVAAEAVIFGFNVKTPGSVKSYAEKKNIEIRLYKVIYDLIDDMRNAMEGLLDPVEEKVPLGSAEVRATFSSGSGRVSGCIVTEGKVVKGCGIRVIRKGKTVHTGVVSSLRRVKEEVKEVGAGLECGIGAEDFDDWEVGDIIETFNLVKKQRTLEEASASVTAALADAGVGKGKP